MKKSKIISSALIASIILSQSASIFAQETKYYGDYILPDASYSDMKYERYNASLFNDKIAEAEKLLKTSGNEEKIISILSELEEEQKKAATMYNLSYIIQSKENSEENIAENEQAYVIMNSMSQIFNDLFEKIYESDYKAMLIESFGQEYIDNWIENRPTDKFYELSNQEMSLLSEYQKVRFGTYKLKTDDGELDINTITAKLNELDALISMTDEELSEKGLIREDLQKSYEQYKGFYNDYFKESNAIAAPVYKKLVKVRTDIAKECGYDNYADYAYEKIYYRDYSAEDIKTFYEYVCKYILPLEQKLKISSGVLYDNYDFNSLSGDDIYNEIAKYIGNINSEMSDTFKYMDDHDLWYSEYSENNLQGIAYTIEIPSFKSCYIYMGNQQNKSLWDFSTLVHEFGHFNTMIHDPVLTGEAEAETEIQSTNIDVAEINSQGFELLFLKYYEEIFGASSQYNKVQNLYQMLTVILDGCLYDEWQTYVYKNPDISIEEMNKKYKELAVKYGYENSSEDEEAYSWIYVDHNFTSPMYYISYAVSAAAALDIWNQSQSDYDGAVDKYMKLSALGNYVNFKESLAECGFDDIFEEETIKNIAKQISDTTGLSYTDLNNEEWYYSPVLSTAGVIDGVSETKYEPLSASTRSMFVEAIGKMYEAYVGIDKEYKNNFSDVDPNEEYAKYISWASYNKIVEGYSEDAFGCDDSVTREQLAVLMYRYAKYIGIKTDDNNTALNTFKDGEKTSDWAQEAMSWAVNAKLIQGRDDGTLDPQGTATRAEMAQILLNYMIFISE